MTGDAAGSGVNTLQVEISTGLGASKYYWTGSSYTLNQTWITTTTASPWFYTLPAAALATGNLYYVRLQLTDFAGNVFTLPTSTFTYNTTAPSVSISTPIAGKFYSTVIISTPFAGTASPASVSGIVVVRSCVSIADVESGYGFNGSTYTSGSFFLPAQGTPANWTYNNASLFFINDHRYNVTAHGDGQRRQHGLDHKPVRIRCGETHLDHHDACGSVFNGAANDFRNSHR